MRAAKKTMISIEKCLVELREECLQQVHNVRANEGPYLSGYKRGLNFCLRTIEWKLQQILKPGKVIETDFID